MATPPTAVVSPATPDFDPADPFRYGWRYRQRPGPDGRILHERIPLTLEDVLHPQEGDYAINSDAHTRRCRYLADVIGTHLADDPTALVLQDVLIVWDVTPRVTHAPDIAVILGVRERQEWRTFDVAEEGVRPALVIELTSPSTGHLDRGNKLEEYAEFGVPLYVIVESYRHRRQSRLRLLGYTLTPTGYAVLPPDERGWLWLAPVRLWLAIVDDEVACYDEAGRPLGSHTTLARALGAANERADAAEERARALEAEVRRLRGA